MEERKVVSMNGAPILEPGEADSDIVEVLEQHLAEARAGRTVAVAICSVNHEGWVLNSFNLHSHKFTLLGALSELHYRLCAHIDAGSKE